MAKKVPASKKRKQPQKGFFGLLAKKIHQLIFLFAIVVAIPVTILLANSHSSNQNTPAHAASLGSDHYGISGHLASLNSTDLNKSLDDYKALGAQWVRDDFYWPYMESSLNNYTWGSQDALVAAANTRGIKVLGIIDYTPSWEVPTGCTASDTTHCPPKSTADYANFAAALAAHYGPMGVHTWEIWNEENTNTFWSTPNAAQYTSFLKAAYTAIKQADPNAFVLVGGMSPVYTGGPDITPTDFLTGIYANGGKGYFDAVGMHPYCFIGNVDCPKVYDAKSGWSQMQDTNPSIRSIMIANGDGNKQIWATEFGAPTGGTANYATAVSETQQAQILTDAYTTFSSYSWAGPLFWYTYIDPCTTTTDVECYFGLVHIDYSQKPAYAAYQSLATAAGQPTSAPTPTITNTPTSSPVPAVVSVTSLTASGSMAGSPTNFAYTLNTTGSMTVDNLIVAIRDASNGGHDTGALTNVSLSGTQSFTQSQTLSAGTYTYWVAYQKNGQWTDLSPKQSITITNASVAISNLSVKDATNAKYWSIQSNIQTGNILYGDRSYTVASLPSTLAGGSWIRTANVSKIFSKTPLVTFTINAQANVYVAFDTRVKLPSWIDGSWTNTGIQLKDSEPITFIVYKKIFPAGTVSLGQNSGNNSSGVDMYTVLVK